MAAGHPGHAPALLRRLGGLLRAADWDARAAAAACIGLIAEATPHPTAADLAAAAGSGAGGDAAPAPASSSNDLLSLAGFDAARVLAGGKHLLASGGAEFDEPFEAGVPPRERAARQRAALARRLGLDAAGGRLFDADDLIKDEDLLTGGEGGSGGGGGGGTTDAAALADELVGLSARERAQRKRAAKRAGKAVGGGAAPPPDAPPAKKARPGTSPPPALASPDTTADAAAAADAAAGGWPLAALADRLLTDLLDARWETRHGAALGLVEVLRTHAARAGVRGPPRSGYTPPDGAPPPPTPATLASDAAADNAAWLEGAAVRLLCVLALDRFGDYVSDTATAPVREAAAQALGAALAPCPLSAAAGAAALARLSGVASAPWEAVHGALLGLKYVVAGAAAVAAAAGDGGDGCGGDGGAAPPTTTTHLLSVALPPALAALSDATTSEDVRGAAAGALAPVASLLAARSDGAAAVASAAWRALACVDDLSPAAAPLTDLLASLADAGAPLPPDTPPEAAAASLWPLFGHALAPVRAAAARCLTSLLAAAAGGGHGASTTVPWVTPSILTPGLALSFQGASSGGGGDARAGASARGAWRALLAASTPSDLAIAAPDAVVAGWLDLASLPAGVEPPDGALVTAAPAGRAPPPRPAAAAARGWRPPPPDADTDTAAEDAAVAGALEGARALGELALAMAPAVSSRGDGGPVAAAAAAGTLSSRATSRLVAGVLLHTWCSQADARGRMDARPPPAALAAALAALASPAPPYDEAAPARVAAAAAAATLTRSAPGAVPGEPLPAGASPGAARAAADLTAAAAAAADAEAAAHVGAAAALAAAALAIGGLPPKLNTVLQPLMACLRRETRAPVRSVAAAALADAAALAVERAPCPNDRVVVNVVGLATSDAAACPPVDAGESDAESAPAAPPPTSAPLPPGRGSRPDRARHPVWARRVDAPPLPACRGAGAAGGG